MRKNRLQDLILGYKVLSMVFLFSSIILIKISFKNYKIFSTLEFIIMMTSIFSAILLFRYCALKSRKLNQSL